MPDIKIELNYAALNSLKSTINQNLLKTAEELRSRAIDAQVIPFASGTMQNSDTQVDSSNMDKDEVDIVTDAVQARRLYYNPQYNFRHDGNANAQGEWWEPWISGSRKDEARQIFEQNMKENRGDTIE